jgi:hypothetical protein
MSIQVAVGISLVSLGLVVLAPWSIGEIAEGSWYGANCYDGPAWRPGFGAISVLCAVQETPSPFPTDADPEADTVSSPECAHAVQVAFAYVSQSGALTVVSYELPACDPGPPAHDSSESLTGATAPSPTPKEEAAAGIESGSGFGVN